MTQTPEHYLSRNAELSDAAVRTGRRYAGYALALAALYAVLLLAIGLLPLTQPAPVLVGTVVFLAGLASITVWQLRHQRTWPRVLTPVHLAVVLALTVVNGVAVVGGTGILVPAADPVPWFVGGAVAALVVGLAAFLVVRRSTRGGERG